LTSYPSIEMDNGQTRLLAGLDLDYDDIDYKPTTKADLEIAKINLSKKFHAFGIMEEFDLSLIHFAKEFNWPFPVYKKVNVNKKAKETVSKE